ncbi:MAG: hypothetical protein GX625_14045 [Clostridiaceae bacterium]|nr:hypothetical protein [Clostridiaceae bacterium]
MKIIRINKGIKRLCCMLLLTMLILTIFSLPIYAMSGVDMSRIKFSENEKELRFQSGDIIIEGGYVQQVYPFTEAEIEKLAREVLSRRKITQLDLVEANRAVEKAKRATEFTAEDYEKWKEDMITTVGVTGVVPGDVLTAVELANKYMTSKSWDDIGQVSGEFLSDQVKDEIKDTAKGYIGEALNIASDFELMDEWKDKITNIVKFAEVMADSHARTKQKWKDIADGANAKRLLNDFYTLFQQEVDNYMRKSDEAGWVIKFDYQSDYRIFSFFGVPNNTQTWYLTMDMNKIQGDEFGSVAGTYKGTYTVNVEHNMDAFKNNTANATEEMKPLTQLQKRYDANKEFYQTEFVSPKQNGSIYIGRTICGECTAVIDKSGETTLTLNEDSDETTVEFRDVMVNFKVTGVSKELGDLMKMTIPIEISNKEQELFVNGEGVSIVDLRPDFEIDEQRDGAGEPESVGWDKQIWKNWDGQEKKLILLD